jgi:hypothetical protein
LFACKKDALPPLSECAEKFIENNNLVRYDGRKINCELFYSLYELNGQQYFFPGCHCCDMIPVLLDCDGNKYAEMGTPVYDEFFKNAVSMGIVAFQP